MTSKDSVAGDDVIGGSGGLEQSVLSPRYRVLTLGIVLAVSIVAFESLGVATILPAIAHQLGGLNYYGWGLSALMLANILGTVAAGRIADRRGPLMPFGVSLVALAAGCVLAAVATNWPWFLLGRVVQGLGVGGAMALAFMSISSAYPDSMQSRMFALLSSAWTIPALIGPPIAGTVAGAVGWRWLFVILLPLIAVAGVLVLPALRRAVPTGAASGSATSGPWWQNPQFNSLLLVAGATGLLLALQTRSLAVLAGGSILGAIVAVFGLRHVTPSGTLTMRRGVAAGVVIRGVLCATYFGTEAFLPLGLTELHGVNITLAGLGLSAGALTWVLGSVIQAKYDNPASRPARTAVGLVILLAGVVLIAGSILWTALTPLVAIAGWAVGGVGMGVAFNASTSETLRLATADSYGAVSAALQLAQTLATALLSGIGGALIFLANTYGHSTSFALMLTFLLTAVIAVAGAITATRIGPAGGR
jgi:MFS family permease